MVIALKFYFYSIPFLPEFLLFMKLFLKLLCGMANSVNSDLQPDLGLHYLYMPFLGHFRTFYHTPD